MRKAWNARAGADPFWHILSDDRYRDIRQFNQSGIDSAAFILSKCDPWIKNRNAVLDIGCGIGRVLKYMRECFNGAMGIDVSDTMVQKAENFIRDSWEDLDLCTMNGRRIPLADSRIDVAYAMLVFEHFPEKQIGYDLIAETYRVLAPQGIFFLRIACAETPTYSGTSWAGVIWTAEEIRKAFETVGLEIVLAENDDHTTAGFRHWSFIGRKI